MPPRPRRQRCDFPIPTHVSVFQSALVDLLLAGRCYYTLIHLLSDASNMAIHDIHIDMNVPDKGPARNAFSGGVTIGPSQVVEHIITFFVLPGGELPKTSDGPSRPRPSSLVACLLSSGAINHGEQMSRPTRQRAEQDSIHMLRTDPLLKECVGCGRVATGGLPSI